MSETQIMNDEKKKAAAAAAKAAEADRKTWLASLKVGDRVVQIGRVHRSRKTITKISPRRIFLSDASIDCFRRSDGRANYNPDAYYIEPMSPADVDQDEADNIRLELRRTLERSDLPLNVLRQLQGLLRGIA